VPCGRKGDRTLPLPGPDGVGPATQRPRLDALRDLNLLRQEQTGDAEIASRIASYEMAYRMQATAPELVDFAKESAATRRLYGLDNEKTRWFRANCLLARRMVERGVRFVQLYHSTWADHYDINTHLTIQYP